MSIESFIRNEVFTPRLQQNGILLIYDAQRRYLDIAASLESDDVQFVNAATGSIESREAALQGLQVLGGTTGSTKCLVVYVPAERPGTDEQKQQDPFSIYALCGSVFPETDGDEYMNLCLRYKPDYDSDIRRVFSENESPSFDIINAVGGIGGWPTLMALLKVDSARDILFALLAPNQAQRDALKKDDSWVAEAKDLLKTTIGLNLLTRGKTHESIATELWRYMLFSEFAFDLPANLPGDLADVPKADNNARVLIDDLCERLRNDRRTQAIYMTTAESIERDLKLPELCSAIDDLGVRDTFAFEERSFLSSAVASFATGDYDRVREILERHERTVWTGSGEVKSQWALVRAALSLCEFCFSLTDEFSSHTASLEKLIDFYVTRLRYSDTLHRLLERSGMWNVSRAADMDPLVEKARTEYSTLLAQVQEAFVELVRQSGWPPSFAPSNADVFDKFIAPHLRDRGTKTAFILIDALRYELGVALQKQLSEDGEADISYYAAVLPTSTAFGMASLLPGAGAKLEIISKDGKALPSIGGAVLSNVTQRMDLLRKEFGSRFSEGTMSDFLRGKKDINVEADLLVLRTAEMDAQLESTPEDALTLIHENLRRIRAAIHKLKQAGYQNMVLATDHGFLIDFGQAAGKTCAKPNGSWVNIHERCMLGTGDADNANVVLDSATVGIRGDFERAAFPRSTSPYRAGLNYCHGGLSLQEAIVPLIVCHAPKAAPETNVGKAVSLEYRSGATKVTTRLPVLEVTYNGGDLFASSIEILLEAHNRKGEVVGEAKPGGVVNPATGTIELQAGKRVQVPLRMETDFEGKFTVKALDPRTLSIHAKLDIETDYIV